MYGASDSSSTFAEPAVQLEHRSDETLVLRSSIPLGEYARCTGEYLEQWARSHPERQFLLERSPRGDWEGVSYGQALDQVMRVATGLLALPLSAERPVVVLSENSVEHALLSLACLHVGVPVAPISPAYSLASSDFAKLSTIITLLRPGLVYVGDPARYGRALDAVRHLHDATIVVGTGSEPPSGAWSFAALSARRDDAAVGRAFAAVTPDTIAKFMFTSGSTGEPKSVINTQRMLCSNQEAIARVWPFLRKRPPVLVDWLPWHHTFGGNHNFNLVLRNGGTLYIDGGRPLPGQFERTLENLREVAPTVCFNVPRAFDLLIEALRRDASLRTRFFSRLELLFYAAAALTQESWRALEELAIEATGHTIPQVSSWGLTETAPAATSCHYQAERSGVIGGPLPGCELKLVPTGGKLEARVRGPNVTPGYWKRPDLTQALFDEEGFLKTGDAVRLADLGAPARGLLFDGRLGEDFKLSTATWVRVGALRLAAIAALSPLAQDVVVTGQDRDEVGFLIFPNLAACRQICGDAGQDAAPAAILAHSGVRSRIAAGLAALQEQSGGSSSTHATRALLLDASPSLDAGEITDKGYINQRVVLERRAALVALLYRSPLDPRVITPTPQSVSRAQSARS
jgi:feruloyl-CoA synthase